MLSLFRLLTAHPQWFVQYLLSPLSLEAFLSDYKTFIKIFAGYFVKYCIIRTIVISTVGVISIESIIPYMTLDRPYISNHIISDITFFIFFPFKDLEYIIITNILFIPKSGQMS